MTKVYDLNMHNNTYYYMFSRIPYRECQPPGLDKRGLYDRNYLTVYELMPHSENMQPEDLVQYTVVRKNPVFKGHISLRDTSYGTYCLPACTCHSNKGTPPMWEHFLWF